MQDTIRKLRSIANDSTLSPAQKKYSLSLEAEPFSCPHAVETLMLCTGTGW